MSAICAIFSTDGLPNDALGTMLGSIREFPHDAHGSWSSDNFAIAACTVHTTAESREQPQPLLSDDGKLAVVFEGHLLNPDELVTDLAARGVSFRNRSDVEIALRAYEQWGDTCGDRMEGEYALIIADERTGRLFATRDHIGFVPLYFLVENQRIIIASDFRAIAELSQSPLEPNLNYLAQIITNRWYLRDETPWKQIRRIKRAHSISFDGDNLAEHRYWTPPTDVSIRYRSDAEYAEHYREVLFDSVRRATRSDREVGIAVSGGLDSSAIFAIADRLERDGKLLAPGFRGYTLAAEEGSNGYELQYARAAAQHVGRDLSEVPLFDPDIDWYTQDAQWHCDLPTQSNGAMMLSMEERAVADGSPVFLNGIGGDEWLQGNENCYAEFLDDLDVGGFLQTLRTEIGDFGFAKATTQCLRQTAAWAAPSSFRKSVRRGLRERRRRNDTALGWLAPDLREALKKAQEAFEASLPEDPIEWSKHNLVTTPRGDLTHTVMRRQRNRIGLESRHPMLSRAFIEFSLQTPAHIKRRGDVTKVIHRQAMQSLLPDKVLNRTTKANFTNTKIDSQFAEFVRDHAADELGELCDLDGLERLLEVDFTGPEGDYWAGEIWGLYASAAFLYQSKCVSKINPASGV